ncbi:MAG: hypothetical protein MR304_06945 [Eubacterium sp.]|nr:hypothetical protein [Eubacterium sp.]
MNTRKRILSICLVVAVVFGMTGCVDSEKQDRLIQFINEDLAEEFKLESEANDLYAQNTGDNFKGDEELYNALTETVIPNYEKMIAGASDIDLGEFTEFSELKSLIIQYWSKKKEAFEKICDAIEQQNETMIEEGNTLLSNAETIYEKFKNERDKLYEEYNVITKE